MFVTALSRRLHHLQNSITLDGFIKYMGPQALAEPTVMAACLYNPRPDRLPFATMRRRVGVSAKNFTARAKRQICSKGIYNSQLITTMSIGREYYASSYALRSASPTSSTSTLSYSSALYACWFPNFYNSGSVLEALLTA